MRRGRREWVGALGLAFGALTGCGGDPAAGAVSPPVDTVRSSPIPYRGADISALRRIELAGATFRDGLQTGDAIALLRARGFNLFRLRLFVSPTQQDVEVNDLEYTVQLAKRVTASGATLLLDLHLSDTWADPGHQAVPSAWASLSPIQLEAQVEAYTASVIARLKQEGALPGIVQVGNEIDGGILWPSGRVGGTYDLPARWVQFTRLLAAGVRGVRSRLAASDTVRIMLHYSSGGSWEGTKWFFDHIEAAGLPYDLIGVSYYPWWHGSLAALEGNLRQAVARYGRDVMVVETSYPWRAGGWESMADDRAAMTWPTSAAGQAAFARDLRAAVSHIQGGRGAGVVWWYPEAVLVPGIYVWGGGSLALFDDRGALLPAAATLGAQ